jgi:hypothetical protein
MTYPSTADPGLLLMNVELVLRASSGGESAEQVKPVVQTAEVVSS